MANFPKPPKFPALYRNKQDKPSNPTNGKTFNTKVDPDIQLSLRYRVPQKLKNIPEAKKKEMVAWISNQQRMGNNQRTEYISKLANFRSAWNDFMKTGLNPLFKGGGQVHIPMTFEKIRALHARLYQAVVGMDPMFTLKPRKPVAAEQKEAREQILQWATADYANNMKGWKPMIDQDLWNFIADGTSITKHSWLRDVRKFIDVEVSEKRPLEMDENGRPVMDEVEKEAEKVVYDGPMMETVRLEDITIVGNYSEDIDDADIVTHRQKFTRSEVIKLAKLGFFESEAAKKVATLVPDEAYDRTSINDNSTLLKDQERAVTGIDTNYPDTGIKSYVINESYYRFDIDDDGIDEELVAWVEETTGEVLRLTYLERVGPGGKRPFVLKKFLPRQSSYYGLGLGEILYGLNNEMDMLHNMRLDYGLLNNLPFGFYRASSGINPQEIDLAPGKLIPVDDPQHDVSFPRMNGSTAYGFQEEQAVSTYADKASGVNDLTIGATEGQGAARTATGASILSNSANAGIDVFIQRYQDGFKKNLHILDLQLADLLPLGTVIKVAGMDGKDLYRQYDDREIMKFECDYCLEGNSANSNKMLEKDVALQMAQMLANPLYLQMGNVTPENTYNLLRNVLQKFGVKNIASYLTPPAEVESNPYSAKDELSAILAGVKLPKTVNDKHDQKLQFFNEFEQSDDFGLLDAEHLPLYQEYKQWHEQMAQAMMANANNPLTQNQMNPAPQLAAQIAAGGQPQGGPIGQMGDLISPNSAMAQGSAGGNGAPPAIG